MAAVRIIRLRRATLATLPDPSEARGTDAAIGMIVVQLLANVIHPLAVLIVTIAGGRLFGALGLIFAALTSAATRVAGELSRSRAAASPPQPDPGAAAAT
jgi:hypothetical protein